MRCERYGRQKEADPENLRAAVHWESPWGSGLVGLNVAAGEGGGHHDVVRPIPGVVDREHERVGAMSGLTVVADLNEVVVITPPRTREHVLHPCRPIPLGAGAALVAREGREVLHGLRVDEGLGGMVDHLQLTLDRSGIAGFRMDIEAERHLPHAFRIDPATTGELPAGVTSHPALRRPAGPGDRSCLLQIDRIRLFAGCDHEERSRNGDQPRSLHHVHRTSCPVCVEVRRGGGQAECRRRPGGELREMPMFPGGALPSRYRFGARFRRESRASRRTGAACGADTGGRPSTLPPLAYARGHENHYCHCAALPDLGREPGVPAGQAAALHGFVTPGTANPGPAARGYRTTLGREPRGYQAPPGYQASPGMTPGANKGSPFPGVPG